MEKIKCVASLGIIVFTGLVSICGVVEKFKQGYDECKIVFKS